MIGNGNIIGGIGGMVLTMLLSACSSEIPQGEKGGGEDSFLKIEHAALNNAPATRAPATTTLTDPNDKIGVFVEKSNGYEAVDNNCFTFGSPAWTSEKKILLTDQEAMMAAVYPYSVGQLQPVLVSCQRYSTAGDLYAARFTANNTTGSQTINLQHVYARIRFHFSVPQGGYDDLGKLTVLKLENSGFIPAARYDLFAAALTPLPGSNIQINGLDTQIKGTTEENRRADCLIIPTDNLSGYIEFSVTLDGNLLTGRFTTEQLCGPTGKLEAGKQYDVNVKVVTKSSLSVTSVQTTDWSETVVDGDYTPTALNFSAAISHLMHTRAGETTTPVDDENSMMGVFVSEANGYEPRYNIPYLYKGGNWYTDQPIFAGSNNVVLHASYPYTAAVFQPGTTLITLSAARYEGTKDLCYATTGGIDINNQNPSPSFILKRAYARLALQIRRTDDFPGACNITQISLNGGDGNFYDSRTLDISNGMFSGDVSPSGFSLPMSITINPGFEGDSSTDILLPPQPLDAGLRLTLIVNGATLTTTIPTASLSTLVSGQFYKIKLLIADNSIRVEGEVLVEDWKESPIIDAGFIMADGMLVADWIENVVAIIEQKILEGLVTGTDWIEKAAGEIDLKLNK